MHGKIVHVSSVHPATDIRIFHKECRTIAAAGHQVTLYARADAEYNVDGVRVVPVRQPRSRIRRMTVGVFGLLRPLLAERADLYHLHDPELIPLGLMLRARGCTVVFDAHEPLPAQIMGKHYIPRRLRPAVARATRLLVRVAGRLMSAVVAASPLVEGVYAGARRLTVVNNFPILSDGGLDIPYADRPLGVVYVGGLSDLRGFHTMLELAKLVYAEHGERTTLIGPFLEPGLEERLSEPEVAAAVEWVGVKPPEQARALVSQAKVGLQLQIGPESYKYNLPTKLFEYMAEGVPVVASDFPLWKGIVEDAGAGRTAPPDDGAAAAEVVGAILSDPAEGAEMGARGQKLTREEYSWDPQARALLALYSELLSPPAGDRR